jgi:hypothetical protein
MAMSQVCRRIVIVEYRYTGKNTVKRRRGGAGQLGRTDHTDEPHNQPNPPTQPHARPRDDLESSADQSTAAAPVEPTAHPRQLLPAAPTQKRPPLYLLQQRNVLPPRPGVFLGRSLRAWSASPWPVRLALAPRKRRLA